MDDLISRLSELRCQYNCFDENERDAYHTLSEAIKALSDVPDTNVGDTISRQAAIDAVHDAWMNGAYYTETINTLKRLPSAEEESFEWCTDCKEYDQKAHCCHRWTKVIRNTVEEIRNEQRWIPVSERLPESAEEDLEYPTVIVTLDNGYVAPACFYESTKEWGTGDDYNVACCPIAWMPLPEPYNE